MKFNKIASAIIFSIAFFSHYSYAYNDDLFSSDTITNHNNDIKKAKIEHKKIKDNLLENHTINKKVIQEQLSLLDSLKKNTDKESSADKDDNAFVVTKDNITTPIDSSKNKIELEEIPDNSLPSILGPEGKVEQWVKLKNNNSKKPNIYTKNKISTEQVDYSKNYTNSNTDQFFGINNVSNDQTLDTISKNAKQSPSIELPKDLINLKNSLSSYSNTQTEQKNENNQISNKKADPINNKLIDTIPNSSNSIQNKDNNIKNTNKNKTNNNTTNSNPFIKSKNETELTKDQITDSKLPVSAIPIAGTALPYFKPPKAIEGSTISSKLLGQEVYLQIFKQEHSLELYIKQDGIFKLANSYNICTFSGGLGPKIRMGDNKSPEGFYSADRGQLQPHSNYYKAINIGFPNQFDRENGRTGKLLMIHGSCLSAGCYAMTNPYIKEIYAYVNAALDNGQKRVDISIYPFKMTQSNMNKYKNNENYSFWKELKPGYDYFQATHKVPDVSVVNKKYVINETGNINTQPVLFTKN